MALATSPLPGTPTGSGSTRILPRRSHTEVPVVTMRHSSIGHVAPRWEHYLVSTHTTSPHRWGARLKVPCGTFSIRHIALSGPVSTAPRFCIARNAGSVAVTQYLLARPGRRQRPGGKGFSSLAMSHLLPWLILPSTCPLMEDQRPTPCRSQTPARGSVMHW
jgi:hypothetical protein